jgi:hypothetical protein
VLYASAVRWLCRRRVIPTSRPNPIIPDNNKLIVPGSGVGTAVPGTPIPVVVPNENVALVTLVSDVTPGISRRRVAVWCKAGPPEPNNLFVVLRRRFSILPDNFANQFRTDSEGVIRFRFLVSFNSLAVEFSKRSATKSAECAKLQKANAGEVAEWFKAPVC